MAKKKNKIDHSIAGNKDNKIHNKKTEQESISTQPTNEDGIIKAVTDAPQIEEASNLNEEATDDTRIKADTSGDAVSNEDSPLDFIQVDTSDDSKNKNNKILLYKALRIIFSIGFVIFTLLFINDVFITPYRINKTNDNTKALYHQSEAVATIATPTASPTDAVTAAPEKEEEANTKTNEDVAVTTNKDEQGRLYKFRDLLNINSDVKGWITIPKTNIDYVVLQSSKEDPAYYLTRDINKKYLKAGSLFVDTKSSVELPTKNITIHGHNMTSTDNMFHYLLKFKQLNYYQKRPVITFDSIYEEAKWKIFAIFITNGEQTEKETFFNYTRTKFANDSDFLNYIYQLRIRSMYHMDTVDINENDQLLTLSTCTYEVKNYRLVIVARKVREGEDPTVDVKNVTVNKTPLNPPSYYFRKGGKAPKLADSFEEALASGNINWYKPLEDSNISDSKDKTSDELAIAKETDSSAKEIKSDEPKSSDTESDKTNN